jgi:hypothetical protein
MSYATIIAAIDAAIESWCDKPISISTTGGRSKTYRSLKELIEARQAYSSLLRTQSGGSGYQIHRVEAGGPT